MKSEHAKMKHEIDLISIEVKQNQIRMEMKEKSNLTRIVMKYESNLISTKAKQDVIKIKVKRNLIRKN